MAAPSSRLDFVFATPEKALEIRIDQVNRMGCLSACLFSSWAQNEAGTTGKKADPRSYCIQKTLQTIVHSKETETNLMFAGLDLDSRRVLVCLIAASILMLLGIGAIVSTVRWAGPSTRWPKTWRRRAGNPSARRRRSRPRPGRWSRRAGGRTSCCTTSCRRSSPTACETGNR